jgi:hypothetical protein
VDFLIVKHWGRTTFEAEVGIEPQGAVFRDFLAHWPELHKPNPCVLRAYSPPTQSLAILLAIRRVGRNVSKALIRGASGLPICRVEDRAILR